jgi:hypothetical protein
MFDIEIVIARTLALLGVLAVGSCSFWAWPTTDNLDYV